MQSSGPRVQITWSIAFLLLWCYRSVFSVLGQTVIAQLTTLSDTSGYQLLGASQLALLLENGRLDTNIYMQQNADLFIKILSAIFNIATGGNAILINICFQTVAFAGLVYFLLGLAPRARLAVLLLAATPSFTVWTSIASKEAIVVCATGIVLRYVVDMYYNRDSLKIWHVVAMLVVYVFKPHFVPAYIFVIGTSKLARYVREPASLALLGGTASLGVLYLLRNQVDSFVLMVSGWMAAEEGNSNRSANFLVHQYDVFARAPEGMLRSFMGPTIDEATDGLLHAVSYAESAAIIAILLVFIAWRLPRMPVYSATVSLFTLFWILFATYPLGLSNPGTAIRYRTDYLLLVFLCVAVLTSRDLYVSWRQGPVWGKARKRAALLARSVAEVPERSRTTAAATPV